MKMKLLVAAFAIFATLSANSQKAEIFSIEGKAIRGYDVVSFFKDNKAVKGSDSLSFNWKNTVWLFSTKENLEQFKSNPEKYAPQYGGYCAYGTAAGHKAPTETDTWTILNDKLYFNYNKKVKELWTKNQQQLIEKANTNWETIKDKE